jgi:hypothetical protein
MADLPAAMEAGGTEKSPGDAPPTPVDQAKKWTRELTAAHKDGEKWRKKGENITKRYLGKMVTRNTGDSNAKLNFFTANTDTVLSILYGKLPKVDVSRKWNDQDDDVARVAGVIMERLLNEDIEDPGDGYAQALYDVLQDRMVPGLGIARIRYEAEFEDQQQDAITAPDGRELAPAYVKSVKTREGVPCDYVNWIDFRWSPCRTWRECRWVAFRAMMTDEDGKKRFGEAWQGVPMKSPSQQKRDTALDVKDPWDRAEVWEIWCKDSRTVYWYVEGMQQTLDQKPDPLGLPSFFPCPRPFTATMSTQHFMPFPNYEQAQDLYSSIDTLETRIDWLVRACKLVGVYDKAAVGVIRMFNDASETELIPVDNWAMFAEKGGIKGTIDWLPIEQVAATIAQLTQQRNDKINLLYQITGLSDILRGQSGGDATATEQAIKARYASTRIQSLQDQFAQFATDLQALKAHVVVTQYDDQTIIQRSNIDNTPDAELAPQAIAMLRSRLRDYRIVVRPENLAIQDYATLKQERSEAAGAFAQGLKAVGEFEQMVPGSMAYTLEILKWTMQGFRGFATIEGVFDKGIDAMKAQQAQPQEPPQPDPTEQLKAQAETTKAQADVMIANTDLQKAQVEGRNAQMEAMLNRQTQAEMAAQQMTGVPGFNGPPQ